MEGLERPIETPEEELAYLRAQIERKELELQSMRQEKPRALVAHDSVIEHKTTPAERVLSPELQLTRDQVEGISLDLDPDDNDATMEELRSLMEVKGIHNAYAVLEKLGNSHLQDDFHRYLVQYLLAGMPVKGFSENQPDWKALHTTLYEIALPEMHQDPDQKSKNLKEMISAMEQFYSGMMSVEEAYANEPAYFSLELAIPVNKQHLMFYAAVPNGRRPLFEKQLQAIFPGAHVTPQPNDYNVFVEEGISQVSVAHLKGRPMLPLKDYVDFDYDPLNSLLNAFAQIAPEDEGAALQIIIKPEGGRHLNHYRRIVEQLRNGERRDRAFSTPETLAGELLRGTVDIISQKSLDKSNIDQEAIEALDKKMSTLIVSTNIRLVVSSRDAAHVTQLLGELESSFNQFEYTKGNRIEWKRSNRNTEKKLSKDFSFRLFTPSENVPLSLRELTTMYHFPPAGIKSSPHLKQSRFTSAPPSMELSPTGLTIGTSDFRGKTVDIHIAPEDRLRHLYVIGQTGTGKTSFMKTLIQQDIDNGEGVCFIDPHGTDVLDILAGIPPERYEDVIYFDPAYVARPFGLNLLEYDPAYPEQKTFIVNEILAIFKRLYGDTPESMGPAFEQYFRNATLLVMEDPESGSTLMDIGRVLSNAEFRNYKLARSNNPVVNQFWNEIATKAEGDASLQNIVPYITNKFDDFTANDFMRPIIGQQESSFKFREIMDSKKILLVNLSKGRLGERNANLLGLILVGKLFMAALSRADSPGTNFPPFYLYIDEFQNITTDSIPAILSEARKYKLSLTIAHQFLAQIDEKIRDAVFGNVGSMAVFRVGEEDGTFFE
ncbi:DUF87 domain-containing protein, partial [Patescibacteria group bacterium]|nr:DUF87 domain-containing protein [Patescibacteria group bacterium]MBU1755356.1 DUF87 domain-containing protein [Patescibacteria group bacterium]